jgi:hypothetical protein
MIAWLLLLGLTAATNLFVFVAIRGRWGWVVLLLVPAALLGAAAGDGAGRLLHLDWLRIGDFGLAAASGGAQLAMLATILLTTMLPATPPPEEGD